MRESGSTLTSTGSTPENNTMNYRLPNRLEAGGKEYEIRSDYRCILDICEAIEDPELSQQDKAIVAMNILYINCEEIPMEHREEALRKCFWFINGGSDGGSRGAPALVSWKKDIQHIIAPINRVLRREVRAIPYDAVTNTGGLHWWTFLAAYMEIGDCLFAQIIRIRSMKAKGKPLDKFDQEWYQNNSHLVDIKQEYAEEEKNFLRSMGANV